VCGVNDRFFESFSCRSGKHCGDCRLPGPEGDRARLALAGVAVFECRYGKPMGFVQVGMPKERPKPRPAWSWGAGSITKRVLGWFGIDATAGCSCNALAREMDEQGPAWSWASRNQILARMAEEAARRGMTYRPTAARCLVVAAIAVAWAKAEWDEQTKGVSGGR
jgi:hypothetical protein